METFSMPTKVIKEGDKTAKYCEKKTKTRK